MSGNGAAAPRIAYLVTSHAHADQVLRLVRTLRAGSLGIDELDRVAGPR